MVVRSKQRVGALCADESCAGNNRRIEQTDDNVRLSAAWLPNYKDVTTLLRVDEDLSLFTFTPRPGRVLSSSSSSASRRKRRSSGTRP